MTQHLRPSQFITTFGPGAIIEGPSGPRVIPQPNIGLFILNSRPRPEDFAIDDQTMSQGLLDGARIFRLPSNAELRQPQNQPLYYTKPFPVWKLCLHYERHNGAFYVLHHHANCPECGTFSERGHEAIRFIVACPRGHMDEVDWNFLVHRGAEECQHDQWFQWYGGGGSLAEVHIDCPECGARVDLGWAYGQPWPCRGRFPEREFLTSYPERHGCEARARIIQRQASNLRLAELRTLFSVPPRHTKLHDLLQIQSLRINIVGQRHAFLEGDNLNSQQQFETLLDNLVSGRLISSAVAGEILQSPWHEIQQAIRDVLQAVPPTYHGLILQEFHALVNASIEGIPPLSGPRSHSPVIFEVDRNLVESFDGPTGMAFRITPILRLRTVMAQIGYRREVDTQRRARRVDISFTDPAVADQNWYPGLRFLGEGIFIMRDTNDGWRPQLSGPVAAEWMTAFSDPASYSYPSFVFRDPQRYDELHPYFVWWHTLSHLLIRAVAAEAGYSSASIRERIYFEADDSRVRGGILLYATQPGSEGTLGGLIALAPYFNIILGRAFEHLQMCSGDPLCREQEFRAGKDNGAACYGCLFLSETSCEHRNMWLDRKVILENPA